EDDLIGARQHDLETPREGRVERVGDVLRNEGDGAAALRIEGLSEVVRPEAELGHYALDPLPSRRTHRTVSGDHMRNRGLTDACESRHFLDVRPALRACALLRHRLHRLPNWFRAILQLALRCHSAHPCLSRSRRL